MITRKDIAAHLERQVRTGFLLGGKDYSPLRSAFCRTVNSDGAFETYTDLGAFPWPVGNAGKQGAGGTDQRTGAPQVGSMNAGRAITIIGGEEKALIVYNVDFEIAIGIDHNAINDDRTGDLESWSRAAAVNFERHQEYQAFKYLNDGEATTNYGAGYDGLSFFNDSHVDPGAEYQTTQDNKYALALSFDNFKTVRIAASKFLDGRGQPVGFNHSLLLVPPDLEYEAAQIVTNPNVYDTTDRNRNPYSGKVSSITVPGGWFDSTAWVLLDASQVQKPVNLQLRQPPQLAMWDDETTGDGGTRYFKWHARYNVFGGDWRLAILGNT